MSLKIRPLLTGYVHAYYGPVYVESIYTMSKGFDMGRRMDMPIISFLVQDSGFNMLVDTGMSGVDIAEKHHKGSYLGKGSDIITELSNLGIMSEDIDVIVLTHLHWDHCYHMEKFKNAKKIVHKKELKFALDPLPVYYRTYESPILGFKPPYLENGVSFTEITGEFKIRKGITVFPTPGHSPGHQSVEIETNDGIYIITGDAVFTIDNLIGDIDEKLPYISIGRYVNVFDAWESIKNIDERLNHQAEKALPSHEPRVLKREIYG